MTIIDRLSPHWSSRRGRSITAMVLHDTRGHTAEGAVAWFQNVTSKVSAHYVVGRDGTIFRCVPDELQAWHAGAAVLHGDSEVNQFSLGIELVDMRDDDPYPTAQLTALVGLSVQLVQEHRIPLNRIVGHDHVAVPKGRKSDPGPDFPWYSYLVETAQQVAL